jgi:tripartite-type tricarboxylate transporter receptor subunit TctC
MPPHFNRRQALAAALAASCTPWLASAARAAAYPAHPVRLMVGATPGGPSDFLARVFGETVGPVLGQPLIVDNKPGASGTLAADVVAKAAADGQTLLVTGPSAVSVAPYLFSRLTYDPAADLVPINMLGAGAFVLAVHPSLPVKSVQELVALARAKPGSITFGSGGNGSSGHLCTELFCSLAGVKMFHVPYKGDGQALTDLLGGQVQLMFTAPNVALPHVKTGRLRLLAVTTRDRAASLPDTPTIAETVIHDFEYLGWIVTFAPAGTPKPVLETLSAAWKKVRNTAAVKPRLEDLAMVAPDRLVAGEALQQFLRQESARLGKVIHDAGIKAA